MNNKGFMMAEVVVVSSIVLITLVGLYTSYNKIIAAYNQRVNYYDVTTLYELAHIRDNIVDYSGYSSKERIVNNGTHEQVYYLRYHDLGSMSVTNQTFKDYLDYIKEAVSFDTEYILVMERCINGDIDNCKYAYLEVYN